VKHFHEQLVKRHNYKLCYTVTKLSLQAAGLAAKAKRRSAHRKKRQRRPLPGMLLFQDGSTHRWIAGLGRDLDLIVTLDDATPIYSAFLIDQEGTMSSFLGLRRRSSARLFGRSTPIGAAITSSRPRTAASGQDPVDPGRPRAPPARHHPHPVLFAAGARAHGAGVRTLQKRLPQELRLPDQDRGGRQPLPQDRFVPDHNARFRCRAEPARRSCLSRHAIADVLCVQEDRVVGADNCVSWHRRSLQIPPQRHRHHYVRATCACTNIPTASLPSLMAALSCPFRSKGNPTDVALSRLTRSRPTGLWICGQRKRVATSPQANNSKRSGHLMCYKTRTSSRATDRSPGGSPAVGQNETPGFLRIENCDSLVSQMGGTS